MKKMTYIIALVLVVVGSTACGYYNFDIDGQTVETGPLQEYSEEIPLDDGEEAQVRIRFGAGERGLQDLRRLLPAAGPGQGDPPAFGQGRA